MSNANEASEMTRQGIALFRTGAKEQAARVFYQVIRREPKNQLAWLWLAGCLADGERQRKCLENARAIDPTSQMGKAATLKLEQLPGPVPATAPAGPSGAPLGVAPASQLVSPAVPPVLSAHAWLEERNIIVKNHHQPTERDALMDRLALFLGEHYSNLALLYERIRRALSSRDPQAITLNLADSLPAEIGTVTSFCKLLYEEYAFLASYVYIKKTKTVRLELPRARGDIHLFFTGNWLERYVCARIKQLLAQQKRHYTYLVNTEVLLPKGYDFELDIFFLVEGQPLWVECKTGDIQRFIGKYGAIRSELGIPKPRAILVGLDIAHDVTYNLTVLHDLTVANQNNFLERVGAALRLHQDDTAGNDERPGGMSTAGERSRGETLPAMPPAAADPGGQAGTPRTFTLLKNAHLRTLPQYRAQFIAVLMDVMSRLAEPTVLKELRERIRVQFQQVYGEQLSSTQAQDMFEAVLRAGFVLNAAGEAIRHFVPGVAALRLSATDAQAIERGCVESFVLALLASDPLYFESAANRREFVQVVGAPVPDAATINRYKEQVAMN